MHASSGNPLMRCRCNAQNYGPSCGEAGSMLSRKRERLRTMLLPATIRKPAEFVVNLPGPGCGRGALYSGHELGREILTTRASGRTSKYGEQPYEGPWGSASGNGPVETGGCTAIWIRTEYAVVRRAPTTRPSHYELGNDSFPASLRSCIPL